jgi:hypothetical protein
MSKCSVWLEKDGDLVFVDVGSRAETYWRGLGYVEAGLAVETSLPDEPLSVEKPAKKARVKKIVSEA